MTSSSSLAFPGSRTLAGWWRQLASQKPRALGVGYLFLHRVETPVRVIKPNKIDRFSHLVLQALELEPGRAEPDLLERLEKRLHLDRHVLLQVLRNLKAENLAGQDVAGQWTLSEQGRQGLVDGEYPMEAIERRLFHFLERCDPSGARAKPPHFINLCGNGGTPWQAEDDCPFDVALLRQCLGQAEGWKEQFGFPLEARGIADFAGSGPTAWQHVILDRPERLLVVLALTAGDTPRLLGFAARQEGWVLQAAEPILRLDVGWQELFPELAEISEGQLRQAWQTWAKPRGLEDSEVAASTLRVADQQLTAQVPTAVFERLRGARSDVFKGETWLLLGEGRVRPALQLELVKA